MSGVGLEVKRETVSFEVLVGQNVVEKPFHQVLHLPGGLPRVSRVIGTSAGARVLGREVKAGTVGLEGILRIRTFYVAGDDDDQPVYVVDHVVPFDVSVPVEGAAPGDTALARAYVVKATCQPHDDSALACELLVSAHVRVYRHVEVRVISGVQEDKTHGVYASCERVCLNRVVARDYANLTASQSLSLPTGAPEVIQVVSCDVRPQAVDAQCADGQVTVEGLLRVKTLYTCRAREREEDEEQEAAEPRSHRSVYCSEHDLPFEQTLRIHEARAGMRVVPVVTVDSVDCTCADHRTLRIEVAVQIDVEVYCEAFCDVVTQVTCEPCHVDTCVETVTFCCLLGDCVSQAAVREDIHLPHEMPDVERAVACYEAARPLQTTVAAGKCAVEGVVGVLVVYVSTHRGCETVEATECTLRFQTACDVEGAQEGAPCEVEVMADQCSVESIDRRTLRVRAVVTVRCKVVQCIELPVVTDVVVVEPCEDYAEAPLRFVVVQRGDTLWNLARKYDTTVAAIVAANNIANPDLIYPGQVLCIPVCEPKG